jgi:hypothetical protein
MHPSIASHDQSIPFQSSYATSPRSHMARKTPSCTHRWNRSWAVDPGQKRVASRAFHWHPVRRTYRMASMHTRSGIGGLPPPNGWVFTRSGIRWEMHSHRSSGMLH